MSDKQSLVSNAFQTFMTEAPEYAQAWAGLIQGLASASALDKKTQELAYVAVLAALKRESGIPFHVQSAKEAGASREEVISAIQLDYQQQATLLHKFCQQRLQPTTLNKDMVENQLWNWLLKVKVGK